MKKFTLTDLTRQAAIASIYIVLVFIFQFMSFEVVQFRIAEVLLILILFDRKAIFGLLVGIFFSNLFSPLGLYDIVFGVLASAITFGLIFVTRKKPYISLLFPSIINGIIIGIMLHFLLDTPIWVSIGSVFVGEFVVTYILGLPLYYILKKSNFEKIYFSEKD